MDSGLFSIIGVAIYTYIMFKIGHSYGYKSAREDLKTNGKLNEADE